MNAVKHLIASTSTGFLFVLGCSGVGKTHGVKNATVDADVYWIDSQTCTTARDLRTHVERQLSSNLIQNITNTTHRRRIIVIDELETFYQIDRTVFSILATFTPKNILIICIGNIQLEKKIKSTFCSYPIHIYASPSDDQVAAIVLSMYPDTSANEIKDAVENCYGNISFAINSLKIKLHGAQRDDPTNVAFNYVFSANKPDKESVAKLINEDPWLMPLRYHENLPKELLINRKGTIASKQVFYRQTLETLCDWDMLMQNAQPDIPIDIMVQEIIRLHTSFDKKKRTNDTNEFTKLFSNLSLQRKNEKSMYKSELGFPWFQAQIFCDNIKYS